MCLAVSHMQLFQQSSFLHRQLLHIRPNRKFSLTSFSQKFCIIKSAFPPAFRLIAAYFSRMQAGQYVIPTSRVGCLNHSTIYLPCQWVFFYNVYMPPLQNIRCLDKNKISRSKKNCRPANFAEATVYQYNHLVCILYLVVPVWQPLHPLQPPLEPQAALEH